MREGHSDVGTRARVEPPPAEPTDEAVPMLPAAWLPGAERHTRTWLIRRVQLVLWDITVWAAALGLAAALRFEFVVDDLPIPSLQTLLVVATVAQLLLGAILQTYRGRHSVGSMDDAINVTGTTALVGTIVFLVDFIVQPQLVPRSIPLVAIPIAVLLMVGSRLIVRLHREHRYRPDYTDAQRVIIYGAGVQGQQLLRLMLSDDEGKYLPVALLDDNQVFRRRRISGVSVRGTRHDIAAAAARARADMLVITDRSLPPAVLHEIVIAARDAGLTVGMVPALSDLLRPLPEPAFPRPRGAGDERLFGAGEQGPVVEPTPVATLPASLEESWVKRIVDVTLCLLALTLILPVMAVIALVLRFTGSGEVIYRAPRIGRNGELFTMFKFATMIPGDSGPRVTRQHDPRTTPVGAWLRTTKLNELPQIFNVLKGDMSLVGPRPEDPRYAAHYSARQRRVLAVRPGMTSLAFLEFGDEQAFIERKRPTDIEAFYLQELLPEKLDIELGYVNNWSLRTDLRILARTFKGLIS